MRVIPKRSNVADDVTHVLACLFGSDFEKICMMSSSLHRTRPTYYKGYCLLASELRAAKLPKNITLRLRQASGEPSDLWKESALMPSRVVAGFSSAQSDAYGWNAIVRHGVPPTLHVANETLFSGLDEQGEERPAAARAA